VNVTAGDLVMALRTGADQPYEINLLIAHRALSRDGDVTVGYEEWLDSLPPGALAGIRDEVEEILEAENRSDDDPT